MSLTPEQIYENFKAGYGGQGLSQASAIVTDLAAKYQERADAITALTGRMESAWQGESAGAAQRGAGPLAVQHAMAAPEMKTAQDLTTRQVESFDHANNSVVEVPPRPDKLNPFDFLNDGKRGTYESKLGEHSAAAENNVAVMRSYGDASTYNTGGMPESYGTILADEATVTVGQPTEPGHRVGGFTYEDRGTTSDNTGTRSTDSTGTDGRGSHGQVSVNPVDTGTTGTKAAGFDGGPTQPTTTVQPGTTNTGGPTTSGPGLGGGPVLTGGRPGTGPGLPGTGRGTSFPPGSRAGGGDTGGRG
ncbi:MAG: hypothetical protein ACRDSQ_16935, partial [Actinokineospora sp.]